MNNTSNFMEIIETYFEKLLTFYEDNKEKLKKTWFFDEITPKDMDISPALGFEINFLPNEESERKKELWKKAFYKACSSVYKYKEGEKEIVLKTDYKIPEYIRIRIIKNTTKLYDS